MAQLSVEEVVALVLREQGHEVDVDVVSCWLAGDLATMPRDIGPTLTAVLNNYEHHLELLKHKLMLTPEIAEESLREVGARGRTELKKRARTRKIGASGAVEYWVKPPLRFRHETKDLLIRVARTLGISAQTLLEEWLDEAARAVLDKTANVDPARRRKGKKRDRSMMGSSQVRDAVSRIRGVSPDRP